MEGAVSSSCPGKQRQLDDSSLKLGTRNKVLGSRRERKWKRIRVRKKQKELLEKARSSGGESDATAGNSSPVSVEEGVQRKRQGEQRN